MSIKNIFEQFHSANFFSRIDNNHPLNIHVGLDEKGRKAIELRADFAPKRILGTSAIEVNQYKKPEYNTIRFSLCEEDISGLFYMFCDDLIKQTRMINEKNQGYSVIVNRFFQWKKMFVSSKNNFLTEPQIMGLIGEILLLKDYIAKRVGHSKALRSWSGQELTHKDFSFDDTWIESKAIGRGVPNVKISSLEQLESENSGELAIHFLEKMSTAYNGITLNRLIVETRKSFTSTEEQDLFMSKVALQGYEYNDYYDDFVYMVSDFKRYAVDNDFPKLTIKDVPVAIRKAVYEISLIDIIQFEIKD